MNKTKLHSELDWQQYWQENKKLEDKIRKASFTYVDMSEQEFRNMIAEMNKEQAELFINKMRGEKNFYKKILDEDYYKENKKGYRYQDALKKYKSINEKGKIIAAYIKSFDNK